MLYLCSDWRSRIAGPQLRETGVCDATAADTWCGVPALVPLSSDESGRTKLLLTFRYELLILKSACGRGWWK
jgi:hypothetical protein